MVHYVADRDRPDECLTDIFPELKPLFIKNI